jgi:hypothetical protein
MIAFVSRFPELAARETRCLHVLESDGLLPRGEYGYLEHYCEQPDCDCRRVLLRVTSAQSPHTVLATINYGWESTEFYTRWMHGDTQAGREITSASLDPLHPQSKHADYLLDFFRREMITDPVYVARLAHHYQMFKQTLLNPKPTETPAAPPPPDSKMTISEILRQLQHVPDRCEFAPYETALRAAIEQREAIVPELIAAIDRVSSNPKTYLNEDNTDYLHTFAIYLLAQFREPRAHDAFLRFFSLPEDQALDLTGDMVTEHGAAVFASVCGGDPTPLLRLARDESVNEFVRGQAIDGLLVQSIWGERPRDAVIADLRGLFTMLPKPGDPYVWAQLVSAVHDFNALELLPEVRQAYAEDLVDDGVIGIEDIDPAVPRKPSGYTPPTWEEEYRWFCERNAPIDAVNECSVWLCFRDENEEAGTRDDDDDADDDNEGRPGDAFGLPSRELPEYTPQQPYIAPPKVGRNEPCPCGSGKKYKKCCGKN